MIDSNLLGRYEYHDGDNSKKYWWLVFDKDSRQYIAYWGRIKHRETPRATVYVGDDVATKKVKEKLKKGYMHRQGFDTEIGSNAGHFIMSILEKEAA